MTPQALFEDLISRGEILSDRLADVAARRPDRLFIYYGEDDRSLTYGETLMLADRLAAALIDLGLTPGRNVSVLTRNALVASLAMFGIWRAGGVYCPMNYLFTGALLEHQLVDTAAPIVITDAEMSQSLAALPGASLKAQFIVHVPRPSDHDAGWGDLATSLASSGRLHDLGEILATPRPGFIAPARSPHDPASIIYTSGTTGVAKGVVQPFRHVNQISYVTRTLLDEDDVTYCDVPLYHIGAFFLVGKAAWAGGAVALYDRFSPSQFWDRIRRSGVTHAPLLSVMTNWLAAAPERSDDRENSLNKVNMQPLPANHHAFARRFGIDFVLSGYGQTESGNSCIALIDQFPDGQGTPPELWRGPSRKRILEIAAERGYPVKDGREPLPHGYMGSPAGLFDVSVRDAEDMECPNGEVGQLCFRPRFPSLMFRRYANQDATTIEATRNLWFHTGDAVKRSDDGGLMFCDRMGDVFRVRGENVSTQQVEDMLSRHPAIQAVSVFAVKAAEGDEEDPVAYVQLLPDKTLTVEDVEAFASETMPRYMRPRHVRFIENLPVTLTNKVEKYKLKAAFLAERGDEEGPR